MDCVTILPTHFVPYIEGDSGDLLIDSGSLSHEAGGLVG